MAKPKTKTDTEKTSKRKWREVPINEDLPNANLSDGESITGTVESTKLVEVKYAGTKRRRTLCVMNVEEHETTFTKKVDGEETEVPFTHGMANVWLPESHERPVGKLVGMTICVTRTGEDKEDTRYAVQVAD